MQSADEIIILIITTYIIGIIIKFMVKSIQQKKIYYAAITMYGGYPSMHSLFLASICTSVYIIQHISILLIVAVCISIVILRDVVGIRQSIDNNTIMISSKNNPHQRLLSHKCIEIISGIMMGIIIPIILDYIIWT